MVRLLLFLVVFFVEEQVVYPAQNGSHHHAAVRQIEHRVAEQLQVEHIHHVAVDDAVDDVADAP